MLTSTEDLDHQRSSFEDKSLRDQSIWYRADVVLMRVAGGDFLINSSKS